MDGVVRTFAAAMLGTTDNVLNIINFVWAEYCYSFNGYSTMYLTKNDDYFNVPIIIIHMHGVWL